MESEKSSDITFSRVGIIKEWSLALSIEKSEIIKALKISACKNLCNYKTKN